jgi:hypothetical protein
MYTGAVRAEDQRLIEAITDAQRQYGFLDAAAKQLLDDITKPPPALRQRIFDLCDPSPRASPFMTDDDLAAFTREVTTKGKDTARWAGLTTKGRRLARRIKSFVQDKKRVWMGAGPPHNVDRALILFVIRRIEEATGREFRFSRPAPLNSLGGPMLRLAEAALRRLFLIADRAPYLGLVSPAYTRREIARTVEVDRALRASETPPANWPSDLILAFPGDVRSALMGKAIQESNDQGSASPEFLVTGALKALVANPWVDLREALEAAAAGERQTPSGLDVLQANLKSGAQPDLIDRAKQKMIRAGLVSPMVLVAERILPDEPPAPPPPSTGRTA